ncbi:efflux RND transporter permease subunit [Leptospira kirschneri]|uniref:efflux RND transporter permease subunit n=1 Tax=Leptospira kirschneri TaxID=29507 RepID=UPI00029801DE|nr:efflux RND transporter permease subunit [Leptospira kirschneri]EKQ83042.1 RND transporter, HAE1 family [Leptospira kirschneri serovar Grippotyphosa str. Moskva]EKR09625.1 RND transporter, HAE1 family [Leptospira kirschneri serovar Valbuzzi str. 200702274]KON78805.1 RND transporter, HAE1 family [Leptospira kirschneri serovar Mozdok]KPZ75159.1 multidrug transporter AcrB [Leptospira kirschneri serovar Mozdok]NDK06925.1 Cation/multidrug efflux pump [Leptospira kirschneri serovar Mozdok]
MLSAVSIRNPIFSWMMMAAIILFGSIGFSRMGVSQMPDVDFPVVNVSLTLTGANAQVMETDVVDPIEEVLMTVEGVTEVRSISSDGSAAVTVELELSRNVDVAVQEIQTKLAQVSNKLPEEMDPPVITKSNPDDTPIIWVSLTAVDKSEKEKMLFVKDFLKDKFQKIPGVGEIILGGYVDRTINVYLDPTQLSRNEIAVDDIVNTLKEQNLEVPSGRLENRTNEISLRAVGEVPTAEQFGNIFLNSRSGSPLFRSIRLKDISIVEDGLGEVRRISRFNGISAVAIGIKKLKGANAVQVGDLVKNKVKELKPKLPKGYDLTVSNDNTGYIRDSVNELEFTLIFSAILTGFVCRLFLGNWKSTGNVLLAIPTSVIGTFLFLYFAGFTINTFTMLGLSLATGIVVDDAIMVLENITRHREMKKSWFQAALEGATEIRFAALAATLAVVAIFLPVAFMKGIIGRYFLEFGVTISVSVLLSLFEALSFTPMRASLYAEDKKKNDKKSIFSANAYEVWNRWISKISIFKKMDPIMERFLDYSTFLYERSIDFVLKFPRWIVFGSTVLFIGSLGFFFLLKKEFIPPQDMGRFIVRARLPLGSSLQRTDETMKKVEQYLIQRKEIEKYISNVGGFGGTEANTGMFFITMKEMGHRPKNPKTGREVTQAALFSILRKDLKELVPEATFSVQDLSQRGFSAGRGYPVELVLTGPDWNTLSSLSVKILDKLKESKILLDVDTDYVAGQKELRLVTNREAAALRGVSMANVGNTVGTLMGGKNVSRFTENGRSYDVRVKIQREKGESISVIPNIGVRNTFGEFVKLKEVINIQEKEALKTITRINRERAIRVFGNPAPALGQNVSTEKALEIAKEILPEGYSVAMTGSAKTAKESGNSLTLALLFGILLSYMILASQFNSLKQPLYILLAMPFSFTGALVALYVFGQSFNMYSFIGLILLLGLVKKNSILLVEFVNHVRSTGKNIQESIREGCPIRLRPVLMTSFSSIAAAIPPALALGPGAETRIPMAVTILGGMTLSTLITLLVVPAAYYLGEKEVKTRPKTSKI